MPGEKERLDGLVRRAETTLRRADRELETFQTDVSAYSKLLSDSSRLSLQIASTASAQKNLAELSKMAIKLEGAYTNSSVALKEYAQASAKLGLINLGLTACYFAMAVSKVMDVIASVTGQGKLITSAKSALIDMGETAAKTRIEMEEKNKDFSQLSGSSKAGAIAMELARAKDLELILFRWQGLMECIDEVQAVLSAIIDLCKDGASLFSAPKDLAKLKSDLGLWIAKLGEKIAKLTDVLGKMAKLYESWQGLKKKYAADTLFDAKALDQVKPYEMKVSDYFSAAKYGLEALVNLYYAVRSFLDTVEDCRAVFAAWSQAGQQMSAKGTGHVDTEIDTFAAMSRADLIRLIHPVSTAPDAREMAFDTGMRARSLTSELQRMTMLFREVNLKLAPAFAQVSRDIAQMKETDAELARLRSEFEGLRGADLLRTAIGMDLIDRERRLIAGGVNPP
jgi:hypothetical protein